MGNPTNVFGEPLTPEQLNAQKKKNGGAKTPGAPNTGSGADQQTAANRVNQNTPFANQQWAHNQDGTWTQNTSFSPGIQSAFGSLQGQMADAYSHPLDNGNAARDQAINSAYGQATSRLDPQWAQREQLQSSQLANQGLGMDSQAYKNAMGDFGRQRNDAYSSAMNGAIAQGTSAQSATFAQNMAAREAPMRGLQGLQGLMGMPGYNNSGDYMQQQQLDAQARADAVKGGTQAIEGIRGMAMPTYPSDERLKQNIQRLPWESTPGVPLALFQYKSSPGQQHLGVIAQDLEKVRPDAVSEDAQGIKHVSPEFAPFAFPHSKKR